MFDDSVTYDSHPTPVQEEDISLVESGVVDGWRQELWAYDKCFPTVTDLVMFTVFFHVVFRSFKHYMKT